jgi:tRNA-dihydrouridine synthase
MGSEPEEMAAAAVKMVEQGARQAKEYRELAREGQARGMDNGTEPPVLPAARCPWTERLGFAAIDVNLACPVKKIAKKARGGHWLAEPDGAIRILEAVREAVPRVDPGHGQDAAVSFDDTPEMVESFYRTIFDAAYDIGCAWVTVHGRTVRAEVRGPEPLGPAARSREVARGDASGSSARATCGPRATCSA